MEYKTFRAFDQRMGRWFYITFGGIWSEEVIKTYTRLCMDGVRWFEFTGVLDKDGVEIFEGDILADEFNKKGIEVTAVRSWNCGCCNYVFGWDFGSEVISNSGNLAWSMVVGNVVENPELVAH